MSEQATKRRGKPARDWLALHLNVTPERHAEIVALAAREECTVADMARRLLREAVEARQSDGGAA
jgi:hypothetical protein